MNTFNDYLIQKGLQESTITDTLYRLKKYNNWCRKQRENPKTIDYKIVIRYIKYLKNQSLQPVTINNELYRIKIYFDYLTLKGIRSDNPLEDLRVKGEQKRILYNILSEEELEDLYYSYDTMHVNNDSYHRACAKRNKVMTGLIVYQALNKTSLKNLLTEHLQPYKGKIYIPSNGKNNSRTLDLKPWQVIELLEYTNEVRPIIQKRIGTSDDKLFPFKNDLNGAIVKVTKTLKTFNAKAININHIRASVICNWLKHHNIRKVQIMCGHKFISSTEKYRIDNFENLQEAIQQFHPLQ